LSFFKTLFVSAVGFSAGMLAKGGTIRPYLNIIPICQEKRIAPKDTLALSILCVLGK
jgi:hypothetical protein